MQNFASGTLHDKFESLDGTKKWVSQIGTVKGSLSHLSRREQENPKYINIIYNIRHK